VAYNYAVKKVDGNHQDVKDGLIALGYAILDIHDLGRGVPDLLVLTPWNVLVLIEVKMPGKKLTSDEERWHRSWPGKVYIAVTAEEVHREIWSQTVKS
jgi:hypothetical protein